MDTLSEDDKKRVLETSAVIKLDFVVRIMKCIEVASAKGAYQPSEMTLVGNVYDALLKGLNEAFDEEIKKKKAPATTDASTDTAQETSVDASTETLESCKIVEE